jgi:hypothetical protein
MTTLHDRLTDLAEQAPPGGPAPELWDRARRVHRVRRAGTVAIVATAVILLAVVATLDWQRAAPAPAPAGGPIGLPDRVWAPSPWLPSNQRPGQLISLVGAEQGTWTGPRAAVVGVSASSGGYAFLDLPGADLGNGAAELAPDGRHIAYWLRGKTTGTPLSDSGPIAGVAVYDTETGDVSRHRISTAHGLRPEFLAWADASTIVFSAGQIMGGDDASGLDQSTSRFGSVMSWSLGDEPQRVVGVAAGASLEGAAHGRILVESDSPRGSRLVELTDPSAARDIHHPGTSGSIGGLHFVALGGSGDRIALVRGPSNPSRVVAGPVGELAPVPGTRGTSGIVDWIDDDTIVTLKQGDRRKEGPSALYRVSVASGASSQLVRFPAGDYGGDWQFATDLFDAPSVDAVRPPSPMDPRLAAGLSAATCVAAAAGLFLWRRRRVRA